MNAVDHDKKKFDKDSYGNLIPKGKPDGINRPTPKSRRYVSNATTKQQR